MLYRLRYFRRAFVLGWFINLYDPLILLLHIVTVRLCAISVAALVLLWHYRRYPNKLSRICRLAKEAALIMYVPNSHCYEFYFQIKASRLILPVLNWISILLSNAAGFRRRLQKVGGFIWKNLTGKVWVVNVG